MNGSSTKSRRREIAVERLRPSPENATLYNARSTDDADFRGLVESIRTSGIQTPLIVSADLFVVSGHSRLAAASKVGLQSVPCVVLPIRRDEHSRDDWVRLLREHNHGRQKTFDEVVRERLVDITPEAALKAARDSRVRRSVGTAEAVDFTRGGPSRSKIGPEKMAMVNAIKAILRALRETDDLPVSVRSVHYQLLRSPPLRNSSRPGSLYRNDRQSYDDTSDVLTRMRLEGLVPFEWIADPTRPFVEWQSWRNAGDFVAGQTSKFLDGYCRDLQQSQRALHVVICEKMTVQPFLESVCQRFMVPLIVSRGNASIDLRHQLMKLYRRARKDSMQLYFLGDCDPDGDSIVETFCASLRSDFGLDDDELFADRVGIVHQQADELGLAHNLEAKETSTNFKRFEAKHGRTDCYELESVDPQQLRDWLDAAIRSRLDINAYNHEVDQQTEEVREILARKQAAIDFLRTRSN